MCLENNAHTAFHLNTAARFAHLTVFPSAGFAEFSTLTPSSVTPLYKMCCTTRVNLKRNAFVKRIKTRTEAVMLFT